MQPQQSVVYYRITVEHFERFVLDYEPSVHMPERSVYATPLAPGYVIVNPEWYTVVCVMCN